MKDSKLTGTRALLAFVAVFASVTCLLWSVGQILGRPTAHAGAAKRPRVIVLHGFSLVDDVLTQAVFPAFQARWRKEHGEEIALDGHFANLGKVTNDLAAGASADIAVLSAEIGVAELVAAGVVSAERQEKLPNRGVFGRSPVVIVTREGNPKGVRDFEDLARPGIQLVQPDPATSGSALWIVLAEFGAGKRRDGSFKDGRAQILGIRRNMVGKAASALEARTLFEGGLGDALVTLEQDVLQSLQHGRLHGEIVYPRSTIVSEPSLAIMEKSLMSSERRALVLDFAGYFWSTETQQILQSHGFRAVQETGEAEARRFQRIEDPFLIQDLGGWKVAKREIVDGIWLNRATGQ